MFKLTIKSNGRIIDIKYGSYESLKERAKYLREYYKRLGCDYKVSVSRYKVSESGRNV